MNIQLILHKFHVIFIHIWWPMALEKDFITTLNSLLLMKKCQNQAQIKSQNLLFVSLCVLETCLKTVIIMPTSFDDVNTSFLHLFPLSSHLSLFQLQRFMFVARCPYWQCNNKWNLWGISWTSWNPPLTLIFKSWSRAPPVASNDWTAAHPSATTASALIIYHSFTFTLQFHRNKTCFESELSCRVTFKYKKQEKITVQYINMGFFFPQIFASCNSIQFTDFIPDGMIILL